MNATIQSRLLAVLGVVVLVAAWQFIAVVWFTRPSGESGSIPSPFAVAWSVIGDLGSPIYWNAIVATSMSALIGFGIGMLIALILGVVVMIVPLLEQFASQLGVLAACLPATAIAPIIVLLSPVGTRTVSILLATLAVFFPAIVGVLLGLRSAHPAQIDLVSAFGGGELMAVRKVRSVSAIPAILAAMKIGVPSAVLGAITGEYFIQGVDSGLGLLLVAKQYDGDYVGMWSVSVISAFTAALGYGIVALLGRFVAPWVSPEQAMRSSL